MLQDCNSGQMVAHSCRVNAAAGLWRSARLSRTARHAEEMVSEALSEAAGPLALFDRWLAEAAAGEPNDPNAMALATADAGGLPSVRMVLLKGHGPDGFVFYTNVTSRKGEEIAANPNAALLFHWKSLRRQVRIEGPLAPVAAAEADAYFASRPRDSQIGAWASDQSHRLESREEFLARVEEVRQRFEGRDVHRPPFWSGWRLAPHRIEFWQDREFRMHERVLFRADDEGGWTSCLLFP